MQREPAVIPRRSGVYALVNRKRRYAYVAYSVNLQKRSHSMSYMLHNPHTWSIADLPVHPVEEWTFMVIKTDVEPEASKRVVNAAVREFEGRNYTTISGARSPLPTFEYEGEMTTLVDAIKKSGCTDQYITVWRRLKRGWTVRQALGQDPPPVRWDPEQVNQRRARAK